MSDSRTFVDTNILVYAHDAGAGKKHTSIGVRSSRQMVPLGAHPNYSEFSRRILHRSVNGHFIQ
jgi:hypothetical protein